MTDRKRWGGSRRLWGTIGLLLAIGAFSFAQVPEPPKKTYSDTDAPMQDMVAGKLPVYDASGKKLVSENKAAMKRMAQYLAYRLVKPEYHDYDKGDPRDEKTMNKLMEDTRRWFIIERSDTRLGPRQLEYAQEFGNIMAEELKFVLANDPKPIVRVNAARMMSLLARTPYPGIVDPLLGIIKDEKELEAVKVYAYQGLRNILAQADSAGDHIINEPAKRAEIAIALTKVITTPHTNVPKDPHEAAAIPYVRREAIRALATMRESVVRTRPGEVLAKPALPLARVAIGDAFTPPVNNSERAEALLGLMQMRPDRDLRLDVWTHAINVTVLHMIRLQGEEGSAPKGATTIPWKAFGARMGVAVNTWKTNAERAVASQNPKGTILKMADPIGAVALEFEQRGRDAKAPAGPLTDWANSYKDIPKPATLYKDDKDSVLWQE